MYLPYLLMFGTVLLRTAATVGYSLVVVCTFADAHVTQFSAIISYIKGWQTTR